MGIRGKFGALDLSCSFHHYPVVREDGAIGQLLRGGYQFIKLYDGIICQDDLEAPRR